MIFYLNRATLSAVGDHLVHGFNLGFDLGFDLDATTDLVSHLRNGVAFAWDGPAAMFGPNQRFLLTYGPLDKSI